MSYAGMGAIGADKWSTEGGSCRPTDFATRATFKEMQLQTNRLASRLGTPMANTTGDIDPTTVTAVNAILAKSILLRAKLFAWSFADCSGIAGKADAVAAAFKSEAGATPIRLPTTVIETGPAPAPPATGASSFLAKLKTPVGFAAAGIGLIVLLRMGSGGKSGPAKRAPSARGYKRRTVRRVGRQRVTTTYY